MAFRGGILGGGAVQLIVRWSPVLPSVETDANGARQRQDGRNYFNRDIRVHRHRLMVDVRIAFISQKLHDWIGTDLSVIPCLPARLGFRLFERILQGGQT